MSYEWLTKGKRRVRLHDGSFEQRIVYPPRDGETYPSVNFEGRRVAAIPQDGFYIMGKGKP